MAKHRITLEVDTSQLFDAIVAVQPQGVELVAYRLVSVLMDPASVAFGTRVGLAAYGITVIEPEETNG